MCRALRLTAFAAPSSRLRCPLRIRRKAALVRCARTERRVSGGLTAPGMRAQPRGGSDGWSRWLRARCGGVWPHATAGCATHDHQSRWRVSTHARILLHRRACPHSLRCPIAHLSHWSLANSGRSWGRFPVGSGRVCVRTVDVCRRAIRSRACRVCCYLSLAVGAGTSPVVYSAFVRNAYATQSLRVAYVSRTRKGPPALCHAMLAPRRPASINSITI